MYLDKTVGDGVFGLKINFTNLKRVIRKTKFEEVDLLEQIIEYIKQNYNTLW